MAALEEGHGSPGSRRLARVWGSTCPPCAPQAQAGPAPTASLSLAVAPTGAGRGVAHRCWEEDRVHGRPPPPRELPCPSHQLPKAQPLPPRPLTCRGSPAPPFRPRASLRGSEPPKCCTSLEVGQMPPWPPCPRLTPLPAHGLRHLQAGEHPEASISPRSGAPGQLGSRCAELVLEPSAGCTPGAGLVGVQGPFPGPPTLRQGLGPPRWVPTSTRQCSDSEIYFY